VIAHEARARAALAALRGAGLMVATAESCTGGLVAGALTAIPGASDVVDRGFVTYSNDAKAQMLGVDPALIAAHGAVSGQVAQAMAEGALARSAAQVAVAITGVAGPGGTASKPEGLVWFACARRGAGTVITDRRFGAIGREAVRAASVDQALDLLAEAAAR
jgi:nicotinamide-nucleotide amidase